MYRCEATSPEGFVQQLAVSYLANGYWFYVTGIIPECKDPRRVDEKLLALYEIDLSWRARAERRRAGLANVQYLRFRQFFILVATLGTHLFFEREASLIRDARKIPISFQSYSISYRGGHAHIRIRDREFKRLKAYFGSVAIHRTSQRLEAELRNLPFEPYAPVQRQLLKLLQSINAKRKKAGFGPIPETCLRFTRYACRPFEPPPPE